MVLKMSPSRPSASPPTSRTAPRNTTGTASTGSALNFDEMARPAPIPVIAAAVVLAIANYAYIDIFDKVQHELPARLLLIGEGPDTILARRQITKKGLGDRVIFLGNQSRVEAVLPCADLFLLPSEEESFGLAALEALASGVPVIGTSGTGLVEVIEDNVNGFLCQVGDTTEMAEKGIALLTDPDRLAKFKSEAARLADERFNSDKIISEYENYYQEVLNA